MALTEWTIGEILE